MKHIRQNLFNSLTIYNWEYLEKVSDFQSSKNIEDNLEKAIFNNNLLAIGNLTSEKERFSHAYVKCKDVFELYLINKTSKFDLINNANIFDEMLSMITGNKFNNESVIDAQLTTDSEIIKFNDRISYTKMKLEINGYEALVLKDIESYELIPFYFTDNSLGYIMEVS